jgi:pyruvate ferredoxin oxidoreductase beta subunit
MPIDVNVQELKPLRNFGNGQPGSGTILGLKLLLQALDNIVLVNGTGSFTAYGKYLTVPFVHAGLNAAAVARGIARSLDPKTNTKVVVFAGDGATSVSLNALVNSHENIIYVCANNLAYGSIGHKLGKRFAKYVSNSASYVATACVSHPEDYINKLKKASSINGFKFIDLLCPEPSVWGYESSNTIEVGRVAVETGVWPVFEYQNGAVNLTRRPNRLEPVENFNHVQKKFIITEAERQSVQEKINRNWKLLSDGRLP